MPAIKLLLDECVDHRLANELGSYSLTTVLKIGWAGLKNGDLLRNAESQFDVLITTDKNLSFQNEISQYEIMVIVLRAHSNRLQDLLPLVPDIIATINSSVQPRTVIFLST